MKKKDDSAVTLLKILKVCLGLFISGLGTAILYKVNMGSSPAGTITEGVSRYFNFSYSISSIIINIIFLVILFLTDKKIISVGTILATLLLGVFIDLGSNLISPLYIENYQGAIKAITMLVGCVLSAIGTGYYVGVRIGTGAIDGMSIMLNKKTNIQFKYCRWFIDGILIVIGVLLGASWGVGTLVSVIITGPIMQKIRNTMQKDMVFDD